MKCTTGRTSGLLVTAAFILASSGAAPGWAQTSIFIDRSAQAQEMTVDPSTGRIVGVPRNYVDLGGADRSGFAQQMAIDPSTGRITGVPQSYPLPGARDRSGLAQEIVVDQTGRVTKVPQTYPDLRGSDRSALAQQVVVDSQTGRIEAVPPRYADLRAGDRSEQAAHVQVDSAGRIQAGPPSYPPDYDRDGLLDPSDNCPFFANHDQANTDLDARGDSCECTDQNGDGSNTVSDLVAINHAIFNPGLATPLCDGNNDARCDVRDLIAANIEIFSPNTSTCARQPVRGP